VNRYAMPTPGEIPREVAAHHRESRDTDLSKFSHP
jgi:hypothetical protein